MADEQTQAKPAKRTPPRNSRRKRRGHSSSATPEPSAATAAGASPSPLWKQTSSPTRPSSWIS